MSDSNKSINHGISTSATRRKWLRLAGIGAAAGLAGCTGGGSQETTTTQTTTQTQQVDLSGTTAEYWNTINVQSDSAKQTSQQIVNSVQKSTGAKIKINFSTIDDLIGANWKQSFRSGNYPVVFDSVVGWAGPFFQGGFVQPFSEYKDQLDQEVLNNISWLTDRIEYAYRGYDAGLMEVPYGLNVQCGLVGRMDHFKQAGLSPEDDFPPDNFNHLIEVAKTLQKDGPGQHGFSAYGDASDTFDEHILAWSVGNGGKQGVYLNEDWTQGIMTNDVWQQAGKQYVETFTKHNIGPQNTASISTEEFLTQLAAGRASMSSSGFLNLPLIKKRAPDLVKDGTIKWAPMWKGDAGFRGSTLPYTLALTQKPDGVNQSVWDKRQQVGVELINTFLSKEVQRKMFDNFGLFPVRKDVWSDIGIGSRADNYLSTFKTMAEDGGPPWSAHPVSLELIINIAPPHIQSALRGNISPSKALQNIKSDTNSRL